MGDAGFYRGTGADQDIRFTDKEKKLLKSMKFENNLEAKVDLQRVNIEVIKPWITSRLNELLGVEDEVVVEYVFSLLEDQNLNPKVMQINLTGFLNARRSREFMGELWELLDEAQKTEDGIPPSILEKKMKEMKNSGVAVKTEVKTEDSESCDWKNRYDSLTGGRYGGSTSSSGRYDEGRRRDRMDDDRPRDRRVEGTRDRAEDDREKSRKRDRREVSRSKSRSPPRRRSRVSPQASRSHRRRSSSGEDSRSKRREADGEDSRSRRRRDEDRKERRSSRSPRRNSSPDRHRSDKHKKDKKSRRERDRD
uniref:PWI domain-containing protein n=1 Tax=Steinernema glaseri TaxID=37863 RepID=A0A1I7YYR8_9BILA